MRAATNIKSFEHHEFELLNLVGTLVCARTGTGMAAGLVTKLQLLPFATMGREICFPPCAEIARTHSSAVSMQQIILLMSALQTVAIMWEIRSSK
jgi:hypothetical protein